MLSRRAHAHSLFAAVDLAYLIPGLSEAPTPDPLGEILPPGRGHLQTLLRMPCSQFFCRAQPLEFPAFSFSDKVCVLRCVQDTLERMVALAVVQPADATRLTAKPLVETDRRKNDAATYLQVVLPSKPSRTVSAATYFRYHQYQPSLLMPGSWPFMSLRPESDLPG
jgi:hypothetical protein